MDQLRAKILRRNQQTRGDWESFSAHRAVVTELLCAHAGAAQRLCALGAGNCNDLDLERLTVAFQEVHLVDLDGDAMRLGVERQMPGAAANVFLHSSVDVTGILERLTRLKVASGVDDEALTAVVAAAGHRPALALPGPFDVVASVCLLSQLVDSAASCLGGQHSHLAELVAALRLGHLRLLMQLTAPGGAAVLATDIVSSDSAPQLAVVPEDQLQTTVRSLVEAGNVFLGLSPLVIDHVLRSDVDLASLASDIRWSRPWRWRLGPRVYAVLAVVMRRASDPR